MILNSYDFQFILIEGSLEKQLILESDYTILVEWYLELSGEEDLDELEMINLELLRMMEKKTLLDRIEKGAALIDNTTDAIKLAKYKELYEALHIQLLRVTEVERWNG